MRRCRGSRGANLREGLLGSATATYDPQSFSRVGGLKRLSMQRQHRVFPPCSPLPRQRQPMVPGLAVHARDDCAWNRLACHV